MKTRRYLLEEGSSRIEVLVGDESCTVLEISDKGISACVVPIVEEESNNKIYFKLEDKPKPRPSIPGVPTDDGYFIKSADIGGLKQIYDNTGYTRNKELEVSDNAERI